MIHWCCGWSSLVWLYLGNLKCYTTGFYVRGCERKILKIQGVQLWILHRLTIPPVSDTYFSTKSRLKSLMNTHRLTVSSVADTRVLRVAWDHWWTFHKSVHQYCDLSHSVTRTRSRMTHWSRASYNLSKPWAFFQLVLWRLESSCTRCSVGWHKLATSQTCSCISTLW